MNNAIYSDQEPPLNRHKERLGAAFLVFKLRLWLKSSTFFRQAFSLLLHPLFSFHQH